MNNPHIYVGAKVRLAHFADHEYVVVTQIHGQRCAGVQNWDDELITDLADGDREPYGEPDVYPERFINISPFGVQSFHATREAADNRALPDRIAVGDPVSGS
ncbi:hypothetical protein BH23ACT3_BH23ACT3_05150 [soil metagenome]